MAIKALSYIGVNSDKFEDWSDYSQKKLGMQLVDRGKDILSFRMDDQKQRLTITGDKGDNLGFMGWVVENKEDLQFFKSKILSNSTKILSFEIFFIPLRLSLIALSVVDSTFKSYIILKRINRIIRK